MFNSWKHDKNNIYIFKQYGYRKVASDEEIHTITRVKNVTGTMQQSVVAFYICTQKNQLRFSLNIYVITIPELFYNAELIDRQIKLMRHFQRGKVKFGSVNSHVKHSYAMSVLVRVA